MLIRHFLDVATRAVQKSKPPIGVNSASNNSPKFAYTLDAGQITHFFTRTFVRELETRVIPEQRVGPRVTRVFAHVGYLPLRRRGLPVIASRRNLHTSF